MFHSFIEGFSSYLNPLGPKITEPGPLGEEFDETVETCFAIAAP